jgi:hypothetical protein
MILTSCQLWATPNSCPTWPEQHIHHSGTCLAYDLYSTLRAHLGEYLRRHCDTKRGSASLTLWEVRIQITKMQVACLRKLDYHIEKLGMQKDGGNAPKK